MNLIVLAASIMLTANLTAGNTTSNLLVNPQFDHLSPESGPAVYVAGWNVDQRGDIEATRFGPEQNTIVNIAPGKRFYQFIALADIDGEWQGAPVSFAVEVAQQQSESARVRLALMGIESGKGTWIPSELGPFADAREFSSHGRGELIVIDQVEARSPTQSGNHIIKAEGLNVDWLFTEQKQADPDFRNAVGILVEIKNHSADQSLSIRNPVLVRAAQASTGAIPGREVPQWSRQIPRTMAKLLAGEPVYILTLGSSIDRGSANPRLYPYNEDPASPTYRQPLATDKPFRPDIVNRPDLEGYLGWFQHYFMYTGRLRLELMRKYGHAVNEILLNVMACDGSSIGESHSGFADYAALRLDPAPGVNGHASGNSWQELYPSHFAQQQLPAPDLIVFGHGHNERIDNPDEIAVFEGAIRWFQRHYPQVEFVNCMWIRRASDHLNQSMPALCEHYGIPFIPANELVQHLRQTTNYYALAPDGGHPQAAAHYLWYKQLEKAFEVTDSTLEPLPQRHLPPRMNPWSYLWEADMIRLGEDDERFFAGRMMIVEDGPFNLWAKHDHATTRMKLLINGEENKQAGRGRNSSQRDIRNSSFVYGRLAPGERHVIEIIGDNPQILASDHKVALDKQFFPAGHLAWQTDLQPQTYTSKWGHPYGKALYQLSKGDTLVIEIDAELLSVAWLDQEHGGQFEVYVDDQLAWQQDTSQPFFDSMGSPLFMENRRAIGELEKKPHTIQIKVIDGSVKLLSAYGYR